MNKPSLRILSRFFLKGIAAISTVGMAVSCGDDQLEKAKSSSEVIQKLRREGLIDVKYAVKPSEGVVCGTCTKK